MSPLETVRHIYAAFGRGDVAAILACRADDVEWEYGQPPNAAPWLQQRLGRAAVPGFFDVLMSNVEFHRFEPSVNSPTACSSSAWSTSRPRCARPAARSSRSTRSTSSTSTTPAWCSVSATAPTPGSTQAPTSAPESRPSAATRLCAPLDARAVGAGVAPAQARGGLLHGGFLRDVSAGLVHPRGSTSKRPVVYDS